ncbi:MAG: type II toxin-antitoxin system VapC family toxin [Acidimicrobiales bacterium]
MIVVDTTVMVYALGDPHPLREPCRHLLDAVDARRVAATTTIEAVQEFAHVRARRRSRHAAAASARYYARLLSPLLAPSMSDLLGGLELFEENPRLGSFDCILAATAMSNNVEALVSADTGFSGVHGLNHVDPAVEGAVESLFD